MTAAHASLPMNQRESSSGLALSQRDISGRAVQRDKCVFPRDESGELWVEWLKGEFGIW